MSERGALSILVLEDSDEDFGTVQQAARRAALPHRIARALTGEACLEMLNADPGGPALPRLVLLDLNTPGMDGRDALREIRSDARWLTVPVIVLSTSANPRDVTLCYASGANAYHVKPLRYTEHLEILQAVFAYWLGAVALTAPTDRGTTP
jgi:CheY-like chemotaxis protein